ncbi:hypothetical protein ACMA1I_18710 [Pontibacter sp. 13R65]|uniref:hypothetical protein n=1 Tax=Pontibacter sp. 13R65 TaxID=3127458 RepID=UPI00301D9F72
MAGAFVLFLLIQGTTPPAAPLLEKKEGKPEKLKCETSKTPFPSSLGPNSALENVLALYLVPLK